VADLLGLVALPILYF